MDFPFFEGEVGAWHGEAEVCMSAKGNEVIGWCPRSPPLWRLVQLRMVEALGIFNCPYQKDMYQTPG